MSRLPETNQGLLRKLRQRDRQAVRQADSSAYSRSGMSVTAEDEVTVDGAFIVDGSLAVTQTADVTGTTHIGGTTLIDGATTIDDTLHITGATDIDGTLNVDAQATFNDDLNVNGSAVVAGVMTSAAFDGNLATGDAGTTGWAMDGSRAAIGELFLRPGSVGNDALTTPLTYDSSYANAGALTLTTSEQTVASFARTIPAGFTKALVIVNGSVGLVNPTAGISNAACRVYVDWSGGSPQAGPRRWQSAAAGADLAVYSSLFQTYSSLSGGTFTFRLVIQAGTAWGATPGGGTVEAMILYTR